MSGDTCLENKDRLVDKLKRELLKGCCKVFQWQNNKEITIVGCVAVTLQPQTSETPLIYLAHINQILSEEDHRSFIETTESQSMAEEASGHSSGAATIRKDIKTEADATSLFNVLPAEMIPLGKGFVVKTHTLYEKTADGEERKMSVSTQGLLDSCDIKAFAGHSQGTSDFKQESQENNFQSDMYYQDCYDPNIYASNVENGTEPDEYQQSYSHDDGVYFVEDPAPPPVRTKPKPKNRTSFSNQAKRRAASNAKSRPAHFQTYNSRNQPDPQIQDESYYGAQPQKLKFPRNKMGNPRPDPGNPYVVTRSMHECGYPGCGKRFKWKQHLLRHQTEKHGRVPSKKLAFEKVLVKNPNYHRQTNNSFCSRVPEEEEEEYYDDGTSAAEYADDQGYYYE